MGSVGIDQQRLHGIRRQQRLYVGHCRKAQVGFVDSVKPDRLVVRHLRKGPLDGVAGGGEGRIEEAFHHLMNRLFGREGQLQIDLGELRLAVGAQVFIAEAARNLEVAVEAADHQQLLEDLRRLRQGVELARMNAARDQVIARSLGSRARHVRRLDLVEALARQDSCGSPA